MEGWARCGRKRSSHFGCQKAPGRAGNYPARAHRRRAATRTTKLAPIAAWATRCPTGWPPPSPRCGTSRDAEARRERHWERPMKWRLHVHCTHTLKPLNRCGKHLFTSRRRRATDRPHRWPRTARRDGALALHGCAVTIRVWPQAVGRTSRAHVTCQPHPCCHRVGRNACAVRTINLKHKTEQCA